MSNIQQALEYVGMTTPESQAALLAILHLSGVMPDLPVDNALNTEAVAEFIETDGKGQWQSVSEAMSELNDCGQALRQKLLSSGGVGAERRDMKALPVVEQHQEAFRNLLTQLGFASEVLPNASVIQPVTLVIFGASQPAVERRFDFASALIQGILSGRVQRIVTLGGKRDLWPTEAYLAIYLQEKHLSDHSVVEVNEMIQQAYARIKASAGSEALARRELVSAMRAQGWPWPTEHDLMMAKATAYFPIKWLKIS